jgi:hypothetical protein
VTAPAPVEQLVACRRARLNSPVRAGQPAAGLRWVPAMRRDGVRVRSCFLNVLPGLTLATLMTLSALAETRAGAADPSADAVPKSDAQGSVSAQGAGAPSAPSMHPTARKLPQVPDQPASRTQATRPLVSGKDVPAPAAHDPPPVGQHVEAHDAPTHSQSSSSSVPVKGPHPATAPPQPARQAPAQPPPAARPPDAHPPERGPQPQPQTKDPDVRDAGPHADRTSRDRAER